MIRFVTTTLLAVLLGLALPRTVRAQAQLLTPEGSPPATRLELLEAQYLDLLKNAHLPLLKQYLIDLQSAQSRITSTADTAALKAEIARVQGLIADKGIVEFDSHKQDSAVPKVVRKSGIVFTLDPNEATPVPPVANGPEAAVPLGAASWRLSALAAGTYDLVAHYTCPVPPPAAKVHVTFAGQEFDRVLTGSQATKDDKTFRVMRLCQFTIKQDTLLQSITITASPAGAPWLSLKQALIVKAKE